jgi:cobalt-zinc-cadmium efflux system protein
MAQRIHTHTREPSSRSTRNLKTAFILNVAFTIIEIVGGLLTNSIAILSDAVHDFGDSVTLVLSWRLEKLSERGRTDQLTFGYKRYSLLGALISALVLIFGSIFILSLAVPRLVSPEQVRPRGMLAIAVLGVVINGIAVLRLKGRPKLNERVIFLHLMEDVLGWVAVLVISIILLFVDAPILDPILSIVITVYILSKIFPILKSAFRVFLQYAPEGIDMQEIRGALLEIDLVEDVHDIHLWSLDGSYTVFSAHVTVEENLQVVDLQEVKGKIRGALASMGIHHSTIEFEPSSELCEHCDL